MRSAFGASTRGKTQDQLEKEDISTEATPTSTAEIIMGLARVKCKKRICLGILGCQNVSKNIELYGNPGALKNGRIAIETHCYLHLTSFCRSLHTAEVRSSIPLSPILSGNTYLGPSYFLRGAWEIKRIRLIRRWDKRPPISAPAAEGSSSP
jgi:hypothetical protein